MDKDEINKMIDDQETAGAGDQPEKDLTPETDINNEQLPEDSGFPFTLDHDEDEAYDEDEGESVAEETAAVTTGLSRKDNLTEAKNRKKDEIKELKHKERQLKKELKTVKRQERKQHGVRRVVKWLVFLILLGVIGGVGYTALNLYMKTDNALSDAFKPRKNSEDLNENIDPIKDPISILILGVDDDDDRNIGSARTDAMLFLTVSPKTNKITMTSIPRDTYTQIEAPNYTGRGKINSAYAYGGIDSTVDAVENLFADKEMDLNTGLETSINKIPINYYLTVDFQAFENIIDALGGIELEVKLPETVVEQNAKGKKVVKLENGKQTLSGEKALAYARTRKVDNDVMRGSRQQQVLEATLAKAMNMGSIAKFEKILDALSGHFWTDMNMTTMKKVAESGLTNKYEFESYVFDWSGFDYNEESMVALHQDSLNYIGHKFRLNLGLDEKDPVMDDPDFKLKSNGIISQYTFPLDGQGIMN